MESDSVSRSCSFNAGDLVQLQCPFQESDGSKCPRQSSNDKCAFGHRTVEMPSQSLRPIDNFCVNYLLGQCGNELYRSDKDTLIWCKEGFHPRDVQELDGINDDLSQYEFSLKTVESPNEHKVTISSSEVCTDDEYDPKEDLTAKCKICRKLVTTESRQPYGLLEHCQCPFCFNCIIEYRNKTKSHRCPACKRKSSRLLIWPFWLYSSDMKQELLDAQESCILSNRSSSQKVLVCMRHRLPILILVLLATILMFLLLAN